MQNFGKLKNIFNSYLVEGIAMKDGDKKEKFQAYVKAIKENAVLRDQFMVYNNIENKAELNEHKASEFVKANIDILKKYSKEEIAEANLKLAQPILFEQELPEYDNELSQLHESISTLIFTDKTPETVDQIVESLSEVVEYIKENETKEELSESDKMPLSVLTNIAVDKYNDRYAELSEDEKSVLKTIIESDEEGKKEIFTSLVRECVDLVDNHLVESETETKEKLLNTKDKLLRLEFVEESFITDVSKLIELKSDLNE